jgi:hypothetical protein
MTIVNDILNTLNEKRMTKDDAFKSAKEAGIAFSGDYHADCDTSKGSHLHDLAKKVGYRKPKNANGSTGRYFYYHLLKHSKKM